MKAEPNVLVVWGQYPRWIPPVQFSSRQTTLAAPLKNTGGFANLSNTAAFSYFDEPEPDGWVENGDFDLVEYCESHRLAANYDFVIVYADHDTGIFPTNVQAFNCPAILLVGDTHHYSAPISTLIDYAHRERFQMIACQFAPQHLHWFLKGGFSRCAWVPGLLTRHTPGEWKTARDDQIAFVGHAWKYQFRRHALLEKMSTAGLPLTMIRGTRQKAADVYSRSLASFNCSLNSDLNIRNFEVLSSRGFLLTDALPDVVGFDRMFRPGEACDTYADSEELLSKIAFYRRRPEAALRIASRGHELFCSDLAPQYALERFKSFFFNNGEDDWPVSDWRCTAPAGRQWRQRLETYEAIQELHRQKLAVNVYVGEGVSWFEPSDCADLARVTLFSATPRQGCRHWPAAHDASATSQFDYVVAP